MRKAEKIKLLTDYFVKNQPSPETELRYRNPFELLVAVVLSAQCTDKRINQVTPALFEAFPTPEIMAQADFDMLFPYIQTVSYPNNKTKHLLALSNTLVTQHHSKIPDSAEALLELKGVGRKTANVILSVLFDKPAMPVDTHVFRVSKRIGLVKKGSKSVLLVEKQLTKLFPTKYINKAHHWLVLHGRYVCIARKPKCHACGISNLCDSFDA